MRAPESGSRSSAVEGGGSLVSGCTDNIMKLKT